MIRKTKHLLEYIGLLLLVQIASYLPLRFVLGIGRALGWLTFSILRIRRNVALENLRFAFPEKELAQIKSIAQRNYKNFGMMMMEYLRLPKLNAEQIKRLVRFRTKSDEAQWLEVLNEGKGAICMTGHFGNWEYLGALVAQSFPMVFLYQSQNNPFVDRLIRRTRSKVQMESLPRGSGIRGILKALRQKKFVAILADQDAGQAGIFVDFLGRPASTAQGPAAFVLRSGAPIIFTVALRQPHGRHFVETQVLHFEFSDELSEQEKIDAITKRWTEELEKYIRQYPDHWFWMHRRWKTGRGANSKFCFNRE